jgi:transglutaminase-like putative cysteine protease
MEKLHVPQSRWWDWAAIGLHFILLQTVASRLVATNWTPFLYLIQTFTYMGFVVGTALGYSTFHRRTVRWLTFIYMIVMLPLQWTLVIDQHASLEEQFASVGGRLFFAVAEFFARQPVDDPLFFVALMSIGFWIISSWAGFTLVRNQNYIGAVLPAAISLIIIQNYDGGVAGRLWFLAFFAFIALLLLGRLHFLQNKQSWRARRIFVSPDNNVDLTSSMAVAAGLVIILAWTVPASLSSMNSAVKTWNRVTKPWQEFTERMENAVSALESPSGGKIGEFFGSNLALGRGFPLSDLVMFEVETPELPFEAKPPRYYWRGRTYDRFVNGQWYTSGTIREDYSPAVTNPFQVDTEEKPPAHFVFNTGETNFSLLYSPAQPIWVSRPGVTFAVPAEEGKDVVAWHAYPALQGGETYQIDAVLSNPNRQQLQEAGTMYPDWVSQKYLQLPNDFSPRIQELAKEITADTQTPFEKAIAITNYLRANLTYSQTIPEPPRNKNSLEWVLFDLKQAYCVYYASAEVLMLRSVGVPARMAVGFTQGERDGNHYIVRRLNSHAWPEVYFPEIGWVEFEPTAGQAPLDRPLPPQDPENAANLGLLSGLRTEDDRDFAGREQDDSGVTDPGAQESATIPPLVYVLPMLVALAALGVFLSRRYSLPGRVPVFLRTAIERTGIEVPIWVIHWERWVRLSPIERAFESVNFALRNLDQAVPVHTTPIERAEKLTRILPAKADEIKVLLDEHQTSLYTSRIADATQARRAALSLRKQVVVERIRTLFLGKPIVR